MATTVNQNSSEKTKGRSAKKTHRAKVKTRARKNGSRGANGGVTTNIYRQGRDALVSAYDSATKVSSSVPKLARRMHLRSRSQSLYTMIEERPLVMGIVGVGVGMVIATLLPSVTHTDRDH